jgi:hypothetical protein
MSENGSDHTGGGDRGGSPVLAAFDDPEPLTAAEVATATGMDREDVESALERQVAAGRLGTKTVGDGITLWYPTPGGGNGTAKTDDGSGSAREEAWDRDEVTVHGGGTSEDAGEFDEARIEAAVAEMEMPGTSEMMRDWRRAAVRGAFDHVRTEGPVESDAIKDTVYPAHSAGYTDADAWWACVSPRLNELPGIERDGERWEFVGVD